MISDNADFFSARARPLGPHGNTAFVICYPTGVKVHSEAFKEQPFDSWTTGIGISFVYSVIDAGQQVLGR